LVPVVHAAGAVTGAAFDPIRMASMSMPRWAWARSNPTPFALSLSKGAACAARMPGGEIVAYLSCW